MRNVIVVVAVLAVLGALSGGFYWVGPPAEGRARKLDSRREADLQRLQQATNLYWTRNGRLPASLDELAKEAGRDSEWRDPESGHPYQYTVKAADTYELCADFARESERPGYFWSHAPGRHCYLIRAERTQP